MHNYELSSALCEWQDDGSSTGEMRTRCYDSLDVALAAYMRECKRAIDYVRDPAYTCGDDYRGATVQLVYVHDGSEVAKLDI